MTPEAQRYVDLWVELDALWDAGKGESPEADRLRNFDMESPEMHRAWNEHMDEIKDAIRKIIDAKEAAQKEKP